MSRGLLNKIIKIATRNEIEVSLVNTQSPLIYYSVIIHSLLSHHSFITQSTLSHHSFSTQSTIINYSVSTQSTLINYLICFAHLHSFYLTTFVCMCVVSISVFSTVYHCLSLVITTCISNIRNQINTIQYVQ